MVYIIPPTIVSGVPAPAATLNAMITSPRNVPHFRANTSAAVTASTNITFTSVEDTESAWSTNAYTAKFAGIYRVSVMFRCLSLIAANEIINVRVNTTNTQIYGNPGTIAAALTFGNSVDVRCAVNDTIAIQCAVGFTADAASYLNIDWLRA